MKRCLVVIFPMVVLGVLSAAGSSRQPEVPPASAPPVSVEQCLLWCDNLMPAPPAVSPTGFVPDVRHKGLVMVAYQQNPATLAYAQRFRILEPKTEAERGGPNSAEWRYFVGRWPMFRGKRVIAGSGNTCALYVYDVETDAEYIVALPDKAPPGGGTTTVASEVRLAKLPQGATTIPTLTWNSVTTPAAATTVFACAKISAAGTLSTLQFDLNNPENGRVKVAIETALQLATARNVDKPFPASEVPLP